MVAVKDEVEYRPGVVARFARILIPALQRVLPAPAYRWVYDLLYGTYKRTLRFLYLFRILRARLAGDEREISKTSLTYQLLPYSMGGRKALENAFDIVYMAEQRQIPGALVECGVAQGGTAAMMSLASRRFGTTRRTKWFFDSYEGLPEPTKEDYEGGKAGHFVRPLPRGSCLGTIEQVSELFFHTLKLPPEEVHLVKGWFQDTVTRHRDKVGPIAVLRLDGDWYESTKIPLDNFFDNVVPGGFVIVDDYATCFGSRKATDEFRAERALQMPLVPDGRGGAWFEKE